MGKSYVPAVYRELGEMLRRIRIKADMTETQLARRLGWPLTRISRMEHGRRTSTTVDVVQYAVACGMKAPEVGPILEFTRRAECKQGYYLSDKRIDGSLQSLIVHESSAEHVLSYEPQVIPGLLQTPDYARARILAVNPTIAKERLASAVHTRMERRQILNLPNPSRFTFYIHEQALRLRVGTDRVMHDQLLHLVLTAALDNVIVRIVPSLARVFGDAFRLMEFNDCQPIVYLDGLRFGGLILEDSDYVNNFYEFVPMLADAALDEGQSSEFAAELADEYDRGSHWRVGEVAHKQLQRRRGNELRGGGMAEEQLQQRRGYGLCGGSVVSPSPIYEP
ncbi:helix-turn-helix domain-containing protein [Actinophytocola sp.]|uniref:helix-turn-helix domain-containing protein n=1 Tax=Actinophytocola sp. TaxID=1872138 RepID=UPI0039C895D2